MLPQTRAVDLADINLIRPFFLLFTLSDTIPLICRLSCINMHLDRPNLAS
jgi:hypothetical protein